MAIIQEIDSKLHRALLLPPFFIGPYNCFPSLIYGQFRELQNNLGWNRPWAERTCSKQS